MNELFRQIYIRIVPLSLRERLYNLRYLHDLEMLKKKIFHYYSNVPSELINEEQFEVLSYLKNHKITNFPYSFQLKYNPENIKVYKDTIKELSYVLFNGKRLYFKRSWTDKIIREKFNNLLIEQDENSPHRYLTKDFNVENDDIVVDIGVAEGNFSLQVIEKTKKIYLFETNNEWIEALEATFEPWKEKVEIINKYVSNSNDNNQVSLDTFFRNKEELNFLKIDVDGSETELLKGCDSIIRNQKHLRIALCTYHKQDDEPIFSELLENIGYKVSFSKGYMIFINDGLNLKPPFLRRGLIRAMK